MPLAHETWTFDVYDFKVYPLLTDTGASATYGAAVDVPGISQVSVDPNVVSAELKGDARVLAKRGKIDKFNLSATYGIISLDALVVLMGGAVTDTGETASEWSMAPGTKLPYFKAAFKTEDVETGIGDLHVTLEKCLLTGGTLLGGSSDEFGQPSMQIEGFSPNATNGKMIRVKMLDSVTALPA